MSVAINGFIFEFNGDEEGVLLEIVLRLKKGQVQYGDLDVLRDDRDWLEEAFEEDLDGLIYRASHLVAERKRRADKED